MKIRLLLLVSMMLAGSVVMSGQTPNFKVRGVGLDSTVAAIKAAFGKTGRPKLTKLTEDDCTGRQTSISMNYPGISFTLYGDKNGANATVEQFEITDPVLMKAMGFPAGSTERQVQAKFRAKLPGDTIEGSRVLTHTIAEEERFANFYFKRGKLVRISIDTMLC